MATGVRIRVKLGDHRALRKAYDEWVRTVADGIITSTVDGPGDDIYMVDERSLDHLKAAGVDYKLV